MPCKCQANKCSDVIQVVVNKKYGRFDLSPLAIKKLACVHSNAVVGITLSDDEWKMIFDNSSVYGLNEIEQNWWSDKYNYIYNVENKMVFYCNNDPGCRTDKKLIDLINSTFEVNTIHTSLVVINVPVDSEWFIDVADGVEHVVEKHKIFG